MRLRGIEIWRAATVTVRAVGHEAGYIAFILRRLGLVIPAFIGITLLTFAFVHDPRRSVMIAAGERVFPLSVMLNCWLNSVLISRCGSSTSRIWG